MSLPRSNLSPSQIAQYEFDETTGGQRVTSISGQLVTTQFDEIALTYITVGNGTGQIGTAVYKLAGNTVATLTLTYDSSNRLIDVTKS